MTRCHGKSFALALLASLAIVPQPGAQEVISDPSPGADDTAYALIAVTAQGDVTATTGIYGLAAVLVGDVEGEAVEAGVSRKISDEVSVRVGYLGLFLDPTETRPHPRDHRARFELNWRKDLDFGTLSHRSRFEHRFRDTDDQTRYRPRLRLDVATPVGVSPFASVEPFLDLTESWLQQVLVGGGGGFRITDNVQMSASYLYGFGNDQIDTQIGLFVLNVQF